MRTQSLLLSLPLWLACGGKSAPATVPEPEQSANVEDSQDDLLDFDPNTLVQFQLVASVEALPVGGAAWVGGHFQIQEGWHLYWINPGESGLPTKVAVGERPGLTIDAARFPGPIRFDSDGEIVNYGYHHELLVPMRVHDIKAGEPTLLTADASWLACREDACVPGKGSATLTLPRSSDAAKASAQAPLFASAAALLPKPFQELAVSGVEVEVLPLPQGARIHVRAPEDMSLELFPLEDEALSELSTTEAGIQFNLLPVSDKLELLVLAVTRDSVTEYFSITSELLAAPANAKKTK